MPPIRFLLRCGPQEGTAGLGAGAREDCELVDIRRLRGAADVEAVARLAEQCRGMDPALAGLFAPAGLCAEMTGREGRRVQGWLAWPAGGQPADRCPLGMVSLVETGEKPLVRASIAWLLVHPAARRRGIATALVRRAIAEVRDRGGAEVAAETLSSWPGATAFWRRLVGEADAAAFRQGANHA